jgi:hypothetical protein
MIDATDCDEAEAVGHPDAILWWINLTLKTIGWGAVLAILAFAVEYAAAAGS